MRKKLLSAVCAAVMMLGVSLSPLGEAVSREGFYISASAEGLTSGNFTYETYTAADGSTLARHLAGWTGYDRKFFGLE
ncbi:MAG: hypothetical protein IKP47_10830 [Ruminococcus sp.]|nr:hypothetical protein [Ruminococcus sp.]